MKTAYHFILTSLIQQHHDQPIYGCIMKLYCFSTLLSVTVICIAEIIFKIGCTLLSEFTFSILAPLTAIYVKTLI